MYVSLIALVSALYGNTLQTESINLTNLARNVTPLLKKNAHATRAPLSIQISVPIHSAPSASPKFMESSSRGMARIPDEQISHKTYSGYDSGEETTKARSLETAPPKMATSVDNTSDAAPAPRHKMQKQAPAPANIIDNGEYTQSSQPRHLGYKENIPVSKDGNAYTPSITSGKNSITMPLRSTEDKSQEKATSAKTALSSSKDGGSLAISAPAAEPGLPGTKTATAVTASNVSNIIEAKTDITFSKDSITPTSSKIAAPGFSVSPAHIPSPVMPTGGANVPPPPPLNSIINLKTQTPTGGANVPPPPPPNALVQINGQRKNWIPTSSQSPSKTSGSSQPKFDKTKLAQQPISGCMDELRQKAIERYNKSIESSSTKKNETADTAYIEPQETESERKARELGEKIRRENEIKRQQEQEKKQQEQEDRQKKWKDKAAKGNTSAKPAVLKPQAQMQLTGDVVTQQRGKLRKVDPADALQQKQGKSKDDSINVSSGKPTKNEITAFLSKLKSTGNLDLTSKGSKVKNLNELQEELAQKQNQLDELNEKLKSSDSRGQSLIEAQITEKEEEIKDRKKTINGLENFGKTAKQEKESRERAKTHITKKAILSAEQAQKNQAIFTKIQLKKQQSSKPGNDIKNNINEVQAFLARQGRFEALAKKEQERQERFQQSLSSASTVKIEKENTAASTTVINGGKKKDVQPDISPRDLSLPSSANETTNTEKLEANSDVQADSSTKTVSGEPWETNAIPSVPTLGMNSAGTKKYAISKKKAPETDNTFFNLIQNHADKTEEEDKFKEITVDAIYLALKRAADDIDLTDEDLDFLKEQPREALLGAVGEYYENGKWSLDFADGNEILKKTREWKAPGNVANDETATNTISTQRKVGRLSLNTSGKNFLEQINSIRKYDDTDSNRKMAQPSTRPTENPPLKDENDSAFSVLKPGFVPPVPQINPVAPEKKNTEIKKENKEKAFPGESAEDLLEKTRRESISQTMQKMMHSRRQSLLSGEMENMEDDD